MSIATKSYTEYTPAAATKRFGVLCRSDTAWSYSSNMAKNIKKGEVIKIFTTSRGSLKLPFKSINGVCLYTPELGDPRGFLAFAVEKTFSDVVFGDWDTSILVDLSKVTRIQHYENVSFPEARRKKVCSTLMEHTKLPRVLIDLINTWLPSDVEEEESTYDHSRTEGNIPIELCSEHHVTPDGSEEADIDFRLPSFI